MRVTLLLPVLNEIRGLREFLPPILASGFDQIVVIDGGSIDGSVEFAKSLNIDVVVQSKPGMRMAYIEAFKLVRGDVVVTFSPDGNSLLSAIPAMVKEIEAGHDMVIASRYLDEAKSDDDTFLTALGNAFFTAGISCFGYRYTDAMVMLRAYRRHVPKTLGLTRSRGRAYEDLIGRFVSWEPLMSIRAAKKRLKITEIPADEPLRVEDRADAQGFIFRSTRIRHFRVGIACLMLLIEELVFWNFSSDP